MSDFPYETHSRTHTPIGLFVLLTNRFYTVIESINPFLEELLMPSSSGIYTTNTQSRFLFIKEDESRTGDLISSLQAFETSLLMIGFGRWTNAVVGIVNAIELLVKEAIPSPNVPKRKGPFQVRIDEFCTTYNITKKLKDAAHSSRKKRNDFTHDSIIPEDNEEAILVYLNKSLGVYKEFLEKYHKINLYNIIERNSLASNLRVAKNLVSGEKYKGHAGYLLPVLVKTIANLSHIMVTPEIVYSEITTDVDYGDEFEWLTSAQKRFEEEIGGDPDLIMHCWTGRWDIFCPADCGSLLSLVLDFEHLDIPVRVAKCHYCGLLMKEKPLIEQYVINALTKTEIAEELSEWGLVEE
tara:strand:- start:597 stop:1655 length:1059 start_codon:yes stop_codon:yes gene_type:complete